MENLRSPRVQSQPAASRRVVLRAIAYAGTMTAALGPVRDGSAAAQDATPESAGLPSLSGTTYIGTTSDANTFVAIVVAEERAGAAEREGRAYICNGADVVEWLDEGGVTGEGELALDLRSAAGAQLAGVVTDEAASGDITLPDGRSLTFEAPRATGADGLYTFTVTPDGVAQGSSATGARLEGQLFLTGTITLPDGGTADYRWPVLIDDVADLRTIFLADTGQRGAGKTKKDVKMVIQP